MFGDCWIFWNVLGGYEIRTSRNGMTCAAGPDDRGFAEATAEADRMLLYAEYAEDSAWECGIE
jgi:hypothetical protein